MDLGFFFRGRLKREDVSSAVLAMLLQGHPHFRQEFLRTIPAELLTPDDLERCLAAAWTVRVEDSRVDITFESQEHDLVFLVENKIRLSSRRSGQLLEYYRERVAREPERRIIALYLVPHGASGSEVQRVEPYLRPDDRVGALPWEDVIEIADRLPQSEPFHGLISSGIKAIEEEIRRGEEEKFPLQGDRIALWRLTEEIRDRLDTILRVRNQHIPLRLWRARDFHQIYSCKTLVSMTVDVAFAVEKSPPHLPVDAVHGDQLRLVLRNSFKLAGVGRRVPSLRDWWADLKARKACELDGDRFLLSANDWFIHQIHEGEGTPEELIEKGVSAAERMFSVLSERAVSRNGSLPE